MKIRFGGKTIVQFVYCIEYIESEACSYFERYWSSYVSLSVSHCKFSVVEAWQEMLLSNFIFIAIAQFTIWGRTMSAPKLERNQGEREGIRGIIRWFFYLKVVNSPMKWSRKKKNITYVEKIQYAAIVAHLLCKTNIDYIIKCLKQTFMTFFQKRCNFYFTNSPIWYLVEKYDRTL